MAELVPVAVAAAAARLMAATRTAVWPAATAALPVVAVAAATEQATLAAQQLAVLAVTEQQAGTQAVVQLMAA